MGIEPVKLTHEERELLDSLDFNYKGNKQSNEACQNNPEIAKTLTLSLLNRKAIPDIRLRLFNEPEYFINGKKSHRQIFEKNGTKGIKIYSHTHFLPVLRYWIFGPELPISVIDKFSPDEENLTSGDTIEYIELAKRLTRSNSLNPRKAAEEFYKLALEVGFCIDEARMIRSAVKKMGGK